MTQGHKGRRNAGHRNAGRRRRAQVMLMLKVWLHLPSPPLLLFIVMLSLLSSYHSPSQDYPGPAEPPCQVLNTTSIWYTHSSTLTHMFASISHHTIPASAFRIFVCLSPMFLCSFIICTSLALPHFIPSYTHLTSCRSSTAWAQTQGSGRGARWMVNETRDKVSSSRST